MNDYEPREIESKWQSRWAEEGRYEVDPSDEDSAEQSSADRSSGRAPREEATFVTVPYPYPSGGMHIGHARTYTVPDVWARYRRLQGDNVLFPIAWHVTGTPIVGAVERLKNREPKQMSRVAGHLQRLRRGFGRDGDADGVRPALHRGQLQEEHAVVGSVHRLAARVHDERRALLEVHHVAVRDAEGAGPVGEGPAPRQILYERGEPGHDPRPVRRRGSRVSGVHAREVQLGL